MEQEAFLTSRTDSAGKTVTQPDLVGLASSLQCVDLFLSFDCLPWCSLAILCLAYASPWALCLTRASHFKGHKFSIYAIFRIVLFLREEGVGGSNPLTPTIPFFGSDLLASPGLRLPS